MRKAKKRGRQSGRKPHDQQRGTPNGRNGKMKTAEKTTGNEKNAGPLAGARRPRITGSTVGERLRSARQSLDIRQIPLAEHTGLSQGYICEIEQGGKSPSLDTLILLAAALNTTVGKLLGE